MNKKILYLTQSALIAAIYVVLLLVFQSISYMDVQIRIAEALTILPFFTPAAIPGVFLGCLIGGVLTGSLPIDYVFGSLTTLVAAYLSYKLRFNKKLVVVPPIFLNAIVVPWILRYGYGLATPIPWMMITVGIGEVISVGLFGYVLLIALDKQKHIIFKNTTY